MEAREQKAPKERKKYPGFKLTKEELEALMTTLVDPETMDKESFVLRLKVNRKGPICMLNHSEIGF